MFQLDEPWARAAEAVVADVLELEIPLNSKEGFVRQVLGWREFVRHVQESSWAEGHRR